MRAIFLILTTSIYLFALNISGKILNLETATPISGAIITSDREVVYSNDSGDFNISYSTPKVGVRAYGFKRAEFDFESKALFLEPIDVKALYISYWKLSNRDYLESIYRLIDETELNAVVVDIKNEFGDIAFRGSVNTSEEIGAYRKRTLKHIDEFMQTLKKRNIYSIARMVVFKDNLFARANLDLAIKRKLDGKLWVNREGISWVDASFDRVHNYNIEVAKDIAKKGFDEINFDYIRFPAISSVELKAGDKNSDLIDSISNFLSKMQTSLREFNIFTSVNTYGYVCWSENSARIGHSIEEIAKYVDYIAPMLYPSGFHRGIPSAKHPLENPYAIIYDSLKAAFKDSKVEPVRFRPWLQAFRDYAFDRREFKSKEIRSQIDGAESFGSSGWMLWNSSSRYKRYGLNSSKKERVNLTLN